MQTEAQLQAWFIKYCESRGVLCYKFASPARRGVPDLLLIFPGGRIIFVEMKSPKGTGRLSKGQAYEIRRMTQQGAIVYVAASRTDCESIVRVNFESDTRH